MNIGTYILMGKFPISMRMYEGTIAISRRVAAWFKYLIDEYRHWSVGVPEYWSIGVLELGSTG